MTGMIPMVMPMLMKRCMNAACHAVAVYAGEGFRAFFRLDYDAAYKEYVYQYDGCGAEEAPFFTDSAEYEIRALFGNESVCSLGSVQEPLAGQPSRPYGYHRLVDIVSYTGRVFLHAEKHFNALSLVILQYIFEDEFGGEHQDDSGNERACREQRERLAFPVCPEEQERDDSSACSEQDIKRFCPACKG